MRRDGGEALVCIPIEHTQSHEAKETSRQILKAIKQKTKTSTPGLTHTTPPVC
jgi:hypothetical protein